MQNLKTLAIVLAMLVLFAPMFGAVAAGLAGVLTMDAALSLVMLGGVLPIIGAAAAMR